MSFVRQLCLASAGVIALLAGCSSTALMDSVDDMSGSSSGGGKTGGGSACTACFDTDCAWEVTECAAEPACAQWLSCAREAPAGTGNRVDGSWLREGCSDVAGATAKRLQDALSACLTDEAGLPCCNGATGTAETGGAAGGTSTPNVDAGTGGNGGEDAPDSGLGFGAAAGSGGAEHVEGTWQCPDGQSCSCQQCLKAFGPGPLAGDESLDEQCTKTITQCFEDDTCSSFLRMFSECTTAESENSSSPQRDFEACLFSKVTGNSGVEDDLGTIMSEVLPCVAGQCGSYCFTDQAQACIGCAQNSCGSEYSAYVANGDALLARWCSSFCKKNSDLDSCWEDECSGYLDSAQDTLEVYGACVQTACSGTCH